MCVIFECSADTIRRRVETLVNTGDIDETQNCVSLTNVQAFGYNTTTLYDLTVFNKLGMTFIDNQRAVEIRAKFNDVLVERETQAQPTIYDYARALIAEKERSDALEAQNKVLEAELTSFWLDDWFEHDYKTKKRRWTRHPIASTVIPERFWMTE